MSVYIKSHEENIYNITTDPAPELKKSPRYKSKYSEYVRKPDTYTKVCKESHKSMGKPVECLPNPSDWLKKGDGKQPYTRCNLYAKCKHEPISRGVDYPSKDEMKQFDENNEKKKNKRLQHNFIVHNIREVLKLKPKPIEAKVVFTTVGDSRPLCREADPVHVFSKHYGKTPPYLEKYIMEEHTDHLLKRDTEGTEQPKCRYITRDEREKLLEGLKMNWEELQQKFQGLPILTDTIPKKVRKTKLETELKQLEKDIVLIERHPYIYVYDDEVEEDED